MATESAPKRQKTAAASPRPSHYKPADFLDQTFLRDHCKFILDFYDISGPVDENGGFNQNYYDDGTLFDPEFKQIVSSCRMIVNYALGAAITDRPQYMEAARHGLEFLESVHWQKDSKYWAFTMRGNQPEDMTQQCYGYAFILLAYAAARKTGLLSSNEKLIEIFELFEERFWLAEHGLYADEISADGVLSDYRGQNSNMHMCEAMIAAYEATDDARFLERAQLLAENMTVRQAGKTESNQIWEHYNTSFEPDLEYNRDDPKNLYRPWGFQPGHQAEWAKLLVTLNRYAPAEWMLPRACELFDKAYALSWDKDHGGMVYGYDLNGKWCDTDKYFWVQAESFATAAMLLQATGDAKYKKMYDALWNYCWEHFIDHTNGAWYRILNQDNSKVTNEKSAAGAKCDYHTLNSVFEVLKTFDL